MDNTRPLTLDEIMTLQDRLRASGMAVVTEEFMQVLVSSGQQDSSRAWTAEKKLAEINIIQAQYHDQPRKALRKIRRVLHG